MEKLFRLALILVLRFFYLTSVSLKGVLQRLIPTPPVPSDKKWFQVIRGSVSLLACALGLKCCGPEEFGGHLVMLSAAPFESRGS